MKQSYINPSTHIFFHPYVIGDIISRIGLTCCHWQAFGVILEFEALETKPGFGDEANLPGCVLSVLDEFRLILESFAFVPLGMCSGSPCKSCRGSFIELCEDQE